MELVENDKVAKVEMNRFLKIIITMIKIRRCEIREKSNQVLSRSKDENGLIKTPLAVNMWGPKFSDNDVPDELDQGKIFPEELFSTFQHEKDEECPAFRDNSKVIINEPSTAKNNKIKYPCNIGGCECDPCPNHHPDHPQMFDPEEDFSVSRRMFVDPKTRESIYRQPLAHPYLHPPLYY